MSELTPQLVARIAVDEEHEMVFDPPVQLIRFPSGPGLVTLCYRLDELVASMPEEDREPFLIWLEEEANEKVEGPQGEEMVTASDLNAYIQLD